MKPKIINMLTLLELFDNNIEVQIINENGELLYSGILCEIDFNNEDLFWREVKVISPGICTYITLGESEYNEYNDYEWKREYMCKWYMKGKEGV